MKPVSESAQVNVRLGVVEKHVALVAREVAGVADIEPVRARETPTGITVRLVVFVGEGVSAARVRQETERRVRDAVVHYTGRPLSGLDVVVRSLPVK